MKLHQSLLTALCLLSPALANAADNLGGDGGGDPIENPTPPTPPVQPTWTKSYNKSNYWGLDNWGAGYSVYGNMSATPAHDLVGDKLAASFGAKAYGRIDGATYQAFAVRLAGSTEAKKKTDVSFNVYKGTTAVITRSYSSSTSTYTLINEPLLDKNYTFFSVHPTVDVGPFDVSFTASATGHLGANLTGKLSNVGVEASSTPNASASLYLSGAIGGEACVWGACVGATAGVYADVTLVELSAPATASVWWKFAMPSGATVNWLAKASATISSLDGEAGVFGEACLGWCVSGSETLIDWTGFSATYSIINSSGSYCFAGTCLATPPSTPVL